MLYSVPDLRKIDNIPHLDDYQRWMSALNQIDPQAHRIHNELSRRFDEREVDTSSWIPGSDWTATVF